MIFLSEQWKLWLILEVTDRWWILYSIAGSNSNIKAVVVGHILLQLGSSPERKVIFTATAGSYPHWGVFGNDSLDQVFPCMSVQPCFSSSCTPGVPHCHQFLPQSCVLFKAKAVKEWESQARLGSGCSPLARLSFCWLWLYLGVNGGDKIRFSFYIVNFLGDNKGRSLPGSPVEKLTQTVASHLHPFFASS